jgi:hypothetical protein
MNNAMGIGDGGNNYSAQIPVFETLYMYNMLDGKQYPLLADGLCLERCHDRDDRQDQGGCKVE